jgi:dihydrofolate synthase/folylpolyglutamate synthase
MRDFARSDSPDVQRQLDRLGALSVPQGRLGLDAIRALLARLGDPHKRLPPTFHVAGTNGKGSTCAFLRAMLEAQGYRVHVTTSPHLVRYNERIRVAGELISDERLAAVLGEVLDAGADLEPSFFEVTIAAAFTEFAREPAHACVVEVGLGGRFDATNVLEPDVLAACGIAALGIDHERFLLAPDSDVPEEPVARIAFEKAGIAKRGVPLVTLRETYPAIARDAIAAVAAKNAAIIRDVDRSLVERLSRKDLGLPGAHQHWNAALAIAMLASQDRLTVSETAIERGLARTEWPARLHRLSNGPLVGNREVWLDGGHNRSAGEALAEHFRGQCIHLILGMLEAKDPQALIDPLAGSIASLSVVPVPGHDYHEASAFGSAAQASADLPDAFSGLAGNEFPVLIAGSLYLAGEALRLNGELPD